MTQKGLFMKHIINRDMRTAAEKAGWNIIPQVQAEAPFHQTGICAVSKVQKDKFGRSIGVEFHVSNQVAIQTIIEPAKTEAALAKMKTILTEMAA